jgi:cytoskeletal protein CcmA (bactofilin family)
VWKKEEEQPVRPTVATAASPEPARAPAARSTSATIGPSIVIRGEVSGSEDLLVQGRIDGSIALDEHSVTVGGGGRVKANISGRVITIEGEVEGDLVAQEQIVLRGSSKVLGDIKAPRVVLEDGASFRGLVDMGSPRASEKSEKSEKSEGTSGGASKGGASAAPGAPKAPQQPPSGGSTSGQEGKGSAARPAAGGGRDAERKTGS